MRRSLSAQARLVTVGSEAAETTYPRPSGRGGCREGAAGAASIRRREEASRVWKLCASQRHGQDDEPKGNDLDEGLTDDGIPELEADWNRVIGGLRWWTAHTRATL